MNIKEVKDLIHEVLQSDINEFELEHTGTKVRLKRGSAATAGSSQSSAAIPHASLSSAHPLQIEVTSAATSTEGERDEDLHLITSPIVGTFYRSPSPGTEPYVKVGDVIEEGSILCIVEAMKLMNEIPSDASGEIVRIFVDNGHPVEFGQKLFGIRLRK